MNSRKFELGRGVDSGTVECRWDSTATGWTVTLIGPFGEKIGHGYDAFEALMNVRRQVEPEGWRIGIAGALQNVWPSGMARDMGSGLKAYVLQPGVRPTAGDLIDVFSPAALSEVVDAETQRRYISEVIGA